MMGLTGKQDWNPVYGLFPAELADLYRWWSNQITQHTSKMARRCMIKDEPELRRAKARRYVAGRNKDVHEAAWTQGDTSTAGGIFVALELAEKAFQAHRLPYEPGLSKMRLYDPRRFTWVCDETSDAESCVKVRDNQTGQIATWPWF